MYLKSQPNTETAQCINTGIAPYPGGFFESFLLAGFAFCIQKSSHVLQLCYFLQEESIQSYTYIKQYM